MLLTLGVTIPGLDPFLGEEVRELLGRGVRGVVPGKVEFMATPEEILRLNYTSRTAIRFLILVSKEILDPIDLESLKKAASSVEWSSLFSPSYTFAVRAERVGYHNFTSVNVAAIVGEAVVEHFSSLGTRIRANLKRPDVVIRAYVSGNIFLLGLDTTGESLHKRGYRVFEHRTSLNPVIAYSLVKLSGWLDSLPSDPSSVLVDPMCGGGTIPIEGVLAALRIPPGRWRRSYPVDHLFPFQGISQEEIFNREDSYIVDKDLNVLCSDISPKSIRGAMENAKSAGVYDKIEFDVRDASELISLSRISSVATDPPYELRTGRNRRIDETFHRMAFALEEKLEHRFSAICAGPALPKLMTAMRNLKLVFNRRILYGGIEARLLAYERRGTRQEGH